MARKSRAGGQGAPGGLRGRFLETFWLPKRCFLAFFRASVAWCFSLAFGQLFVRRSFCLKDVRAPRANGAHADYIVKNNGFKHIFKLCFRAGERRGEQNTHGSGKKTHATKALKICVYWHFWCLFFRSRQPNQNKIHKMTSQSPSGTLPGTLPEGVPRPPR